MDREAFQLSKLIICTEAENQMAYFGASESIEALATRRGRTAATSETLSGSKRGRASRESATHKESKPAVSAARQKATSSAGSAIRTCFASRVERKRPTLNPSR